MGGALGRLGSSSGFLKIVEISVEQFDGSVEFFPALIEEILADDFFVIGDEEMVEDFVVRSASVGAEFGVV